MPKPGMMIKWHHDDWAEPITRDEAAQKIRHYRSSVNPRLKFKVQRKYGDIYIASPVIGLGCCIYRADS